MNITFDKTSDAAAVLTLQIVKSDYEQKVAAGLKKYGARADIKGFRRGHVPQSMLRKLFGTQIKLETINQMVDENVRNYIVENKVDMLGFPMQHEEHEPQDIENQDDFEFKFDVALTPAFELELTSKDKVAYYDLEVSDKEVDQEISMMQRQMGHNELVDEYQEGDIIRGIIAELDAIGQPLEGGLQNEKGSLMPQYFKSEDQKKLFASAKKNDVITFCPNEAYEGSEVELASMLGVKKEELGDHKESKYSFQVNEISRYVQAPIDQELFDNVFGKDAVKTEDEFRTRVKENLQQRAASESDSRFGVDLREYCEKKVGVLPFDEKLIKRIMKNNNPDKDDAYFDENYADTVKALTWQVISDRLAQQFGVKIEQNELKEAAMMTTRMQFMQYGFGQVPEEFVEKYANEMLEKSEQRENLVYRIMQNKVTQAAKNVVSLKRKSVDRAAFDKLYETKEEKKK